MLSKYDNINTMDVRTRITAEARARGFTAAELARRIGGYRSNVSAMDAGRRSISLRTLAGFAKVLGCSPTDLLEVGDRSRGPLFRQRHLNTRLAQRDFGTPDGAEKGWVHVVQLAWRRHYRASSKVA